MKRAGLTLIETVISVAIVSLLFAASLNMAGVAGTTQSLATDRRIGEELCEALLAEILAKPFLDPDTATDEHGPTGSETDGGTRSQFDHIGDYHGWSASPPVSASGIVIDGASGMTRTVHITRYINESRTDLFEHAGQVKVIYVSVRRGDRDVYQLRAVRVPDWDERESKR